MGLSRREADQAIDELARKQFGAMNRRQLLERRLSYDQIEDRTANGELVFLGNGVYAARGAPATSLRQYKAAELAVRDAAICGLAASCLLDLGATRSAAPEIVVRPSTTSRCGFARVHRRVDVETTTVQGIRVTTVAQTLVDIAGRLRISRLEDVWTDALARDRTTLAALKDRVGAAASHRLKNRGIAMGMFAALADGSELAESQLEVLLHGIASRVPGIPPIVRQPSLPWWRGGTGRGDVGVPDWRLILEADGRSWHARLRSFDDDRRRDNLAAANGFQVMRFSAIHLQRGPDDVAALIAGAGRHRRSA